MKATTKAWWHSRELCCTSLSYIGTLFKQLGWLLALSAILGLQNVQAAAGDPSDQGVQPMEFDGNPTCSDLLDIPDLRELRVEPVADGTYSDGTLEVMIAVQEGSKTFSWDQGSSAVIIQGVFVKGGPGGNLYEYYSDGLLVNSDGGLHSPVGKNGKYAGLSHISFCYTPGKPEIKITKTCTFGGVGDDGQSLKYNYSLIVENTGQLPLYDIKAIDVTAVEKDLDGGMHQYDLAMLAVGGSEEFNGMLRVAQNGIMNKATVEAAVASGGVTAVNDDDTFDCPSQNIPGQLDLQKDCDVVVKNRFDETGLNEYGLQVNYSGSVCNNSIVTVEGIVVTDSEDSDGPTYMKDGMGLSAPFALGPGECADFAGNYDPVPQMGEGLPLPGEEVRGFTDMVDASGITVFGGTVNVMPAEATCNLCPECPEPENCPE